MLHNVAIAGVMVADVDETEPTGTGLLLVTLTVLADTDSANGILSVTPSGTAAVPVNNGRVLTIRGTQDDVNATLATLLYTLPNTDFNELNNQDGLNPTGGVFVSLHVSDEANTGDPPPVVGTDAKTVTITVLPVNDAPTFVPDGNVQLDEDDTASMVRPGWATGITVGPATATDEASQTLTFHVTVLQTTGTLQFTALPAIDATTGTLTFQTAPDTNGTATVTVQLQDSGGTDRNGVDVYPSPAYTFTITVNAVNDPPTFTPGGDLTGATAILEDAGLQSFAGWATNMKPGPDTATDESGQTWTFEVLVTSTTTYMAFTTPPSVSPAGVLAFQTAPDANGTATVTVQMIDSGGARSLLTHTLTITATAVNDAALLTPARSMSRSPRISDRFSGCSGRRTSCPARPPPRTNYRPRRH